MKNGYEVPIVLFIFRRLDSVKMLMKVMQNIKPQRFYVFADGARKGKENELLQVQEVRKLVMESINWECDFQPFYSEINKGCAKNICDGLDYVFQHEKHAVIFEDDACPTEFFFKYASFLLKKYENDRRIQYIAGFNAIGSSKIIEESYTFSKNAPMTGAIATWADRWNECDFEMKNWPENKRKNRFRKYFFYSELYHVTCAAMDDSYLNVNDGWDYQFHHDMLDKERMAIVPKYNLVESQVYCGNAFHPLRASQEKKVERIVGHATQQYYFPMDEPIEVAWNREYDKLRQRLFLDINGNYFQRHLYYMYRKIKDIAYNNLPDNIWEKLAKIVKGNKQN